MITRRSILGAATVCAAGAAHGAVFAQAPPFKLFDTHAHFYTDDLAHYPLSGSGNTAMPMDKVKARVLARPTTLRNMLAWWDAAGVEGGVGVQYRTTYGTDNRYLLVCADQAKARIAPVLVVDATDPATPARVRNLALTRGVAGVRLTGMEIDGGFPWLESEAAQRTWAVADDLGLAVVLMYLPPDLNRAGAALALRRIAVLADRYPHANVVLDHLGWPAPTGAPDYGLTLEHVALKAHRNVYFKFTTAGVEILQAAKQSTADFVRHAVDVYGADRMMWGSDMGNSAGDYPQLVADAMEATRALSLEEKRRMLRETGMAVFVRGGKAALAKTG